MSIRSITPCSSCSEPIGISVATTCWPNAAFSESSARKKSARSRSSMFTKMRRDEAELLGALPEAVGAHLDAHHAVHHEHRALADPQRGQGVGHEARLARRVDEVDLAVLPPEGGEARGDRHLARLLVGRGVGHRGAVGHRAQAVDRARLEQQGLVQRGLAAPPVAHQSHVADPLRTFVASGPLLVSFPESETYVASAQALPAGGRGWAAPRAARRLRRSRPAGGTSGAARPWCAAARRATR